MTEKIIGHSGHFIDHDDGTVTDTRSGLMWMRPAVGQKWDGRNCTGSASRFKFAREATAVRRYFAGYSDWRLPTIVELKHLINPETVSLTRAEPNSWLLENQVFQGQYREGFWSSTTVVSPGSGRDGWTWTIAACDGTPVVSHSRIESLCVRLVRSHQIGHSHEERFLLDTQIRGSGDAEVRAYPSAESYPSGTTVTLIARESHGFEFKEWVGDGVGLGNTYVVTMNAEKSVTAVFSPIGFFELDLRTIGTGDGEISCVPKMDRFPKGEIVRLTALAATGSSFVGWRGGANDVGNVCKVTMDSAKSVSAEFVLDQSAPVQTTKSVALPVFQMEQIETRRSNQEGAAGSPLSVGHSSVDAVDKKYEQGEKASQWLHFIDHGDGTVTDRRSGLMWMRPAVGQKWDGRSCTGSTSRFKFAREATSVRRDFAGYSDWRLPTIVELQHLINPETGSLTRAEPTSWLPENQVFQGQCRKDFWSSTTVVSPGSERHGWTWSFSERDGTPGISHPEMELLCIRLVRSHHARHSHEECFLLDIQIRGSGDADVRAYPSAESYPSGTTVTLIARKSYGYEFKAWVGDGVSLGNTYVVTMNAGKSVTAVFSQIGFFELDLQTIGIGDGEISCIPKMGRYPKGEIVRLTALAATGSSFIGWRGGANDVGNVCKVTMDSAKSVSAEFVLDESAPVQITKSVALPVLRMEQIETRRSNQDGAAGSPVSVGHSSVDAVDKKYEQGEKGSQWLHFIDNDDGTATDKRTGLMWMRAALGQSWSGYECIGQPSRFSFIEAKNIVSGVAGYLDWRLPRANELESLIGFVTGSKSDSLVFSSQLGEDVRFWSTTGRKIDLSANSDADAFNESLDPRVYVRLVRGGFEYPISITTNGSGTGVITRSLVSNNYPHGTTITLTASADEFCVFMGWTGDAAGVTDRCKVIMDSEKNISAEFEKLKFFELTVASTGTGVGAIMQSPNDVKHFQGSLVKLTALPEKGTRFVRWHGDVNVAGADCTVTMDSIKSVSGEFAESEKFTLLVTTTGAGVGQINRSLDAKNYILGTEITLTATAHEGSKFKCWHGDASGKAATIGITMDSAKSISAEFSELEAYALNVNFSGTGHGVVNRSSDSETHYRGTPIVLTAQAANGSTFSGWHGDASGVDDSCILKMTSAKTVTAQFEKVCVDDLGIAVEFESAKPATMVDGDAVIIFYFNIRNKGERQVRVTLPLATYISRIGEEIEQDNWLSGLVIGAKGSTIRAGAFRKTGLVFLKSRLLPISKGECLFVTVEQTNPPVIMNFTFRCKHAGLSEFELIKATAVAKHAAEEDAENLSAMALIVQRLELLESGLTEALRKLDALQDGRLLPLGDPAVRSAPAQTPPDVLRWLSTQVNISVADLRIKLLPLDLLPSAVIDDINERALDLTGVVALEDDGATVTVQQEVLLEVIAQWKG